MINWPELTLPTTLRGKDLTAFESTRPEVRAGCDSCDNTGLARDGSVEVLVPGITDRCWTNVVNGVAARLPTANDTKMRRCGGPCTPL